MSQDSRTRLEERKCSTSFAIETRQRKPARRYALYRGKGEAPGTSRHDGLGRNLANERKEKLKGSRGDEGVIDHHRQLAPWTIDRGVRMRRLESIKKI